MNIAIITDYLGRFGSKQKSTLYREGMDLKKITNLLFAKKINFKIFDFVNCLELLTISESYFIIYTSAEDPGEHYKSFIEDNIKMLSMSHHTCVPNEIFLRAHNNKIFMEMLRIRFNFNDTNLFNSRFIATKQELLKLNLEYPVVMKGAVGALSRTVKIAKNINEAIVNFNLLSPQVSLKIRIKEFLRRIRHRKNYNPEALKRGKIIVQNFIPDILYDWKVLVYFDHIFVLKRNNRPDDFRASGSGLFSYVREVPDNVLNLAFETRQLLDVPHLSMDIAIANDQPIIFEFQVLGFGTKTLENASFYFEKNKENWIIKEDKVELEEVYVNSLHSYLKFKNL